MSTTVWDKLLDGDDLHPHVEDDIRMGSFEIMNSRLLQFEEMWAGMPAYYFIQTCKHDGWRYKAVVLIPEPDEQGRIGCAVEIKRGEWSPMFLSLSSLRHREQVVVLK